MMTGGWSHGRQVAATLISAGLLFLGIFGIRETDRREIVASLTKIEETQAALVENVASLKALVPAEALVGQTVSEIRARQQMNEHRLDVIEKQLWAKPGP